MGTSSNFSGNARETSTDVRSIASSKKSQSAGGSSFHQVVNDEPPKFKRQYMQQPQSTNRRDSSHSLFTPSLHAATRTTVSYTHLDVYKRQTLNSVVVNFQEIGLTFF